jgi:hypothetical protein
VKRRAILASPRIHQTIVGAWREASTWLVGRYLMMPDEWPYQGELNILQW